LSTRRSRDIQYAERLYAAIRAANFSPLSFLAFGNAVKDGVDLRRMPRIAVKPFMRVVGDMLDLEEAAMQEDVIDADVQAAGIQPLGEAPIASAPVASAANGTGDTSVRDEAPGSGGALPRTNE
jgi:hypothetical protein